jgi:2-desacetyl-2-hydroxyethyl bacteriochlorophyllide A dehydrogenase
MKAAIFRGARNITIEDVPEPKVEPDDVVVKVKACGVCGSDLHLYKWGGQNEGTILGHEFSGDVVEIGENVTGVKKGDRVTAIGGRGCGQCYWCQQGQLLRCRSLIFLGWGLPGAFAQYVPVPFFQIGQYAAKLPDTMTYEEGATAEPVAVALYAVTKAQPQPEDTVVVLGAGMIGLCLVQVLKAFGVSQVIVSEPREKRLKLAKETGADLVLNAAREDIVSIVNEVTSGRGADIVFECVGLSTTYQQAIEMVHRGGKVELVGLYEQPVTWDPTPTVTDDITLIGCGLRWDLPGAVDLLQSGKVNTKPLLTHEFPLDKVKEAFETQLEAEDAVKVLVKP